MRERINEWVGLVCILAWLVSSLFTVQNPDLFQRMGSLGVFLNGFGLGYSTYVWNSRLAKADLEFEKARIALNQRTIRVLLSLSDFRLRDISDKKLQAFVAQNETENLSSVIKTLKTTLDRATELEAGYLGRESKHSRKAQINNLRLELASVGLATLQWGFGDLLIRQVVPG